MLNKRFHIHLICATDDQVDLLDCLAIFMENKAFLTRDLSMGNSESASYSRRCIEDCDFTIVLVGDSYGKLNNTGVSQMHLSYIYAKTKAKPMLVLLKMHEFNAKDGLSRQLADFSRMVEEQNSGSLYYYDNDVKIQEFILPLYNKFIKEHAGLGWVRSVSIISDNFDDNDTFSSKKQVKNTNKNNSTKPITASSRVTRNQNASNKQPSKKSMSKSRKASSLNANNSKTEQKPTVKAPNINTHIMVNFSTHAYQAGNLADVTLNASMTWKEILHSLNHSFEVISIPTFQRVINELVNSKALKLVQEKNAFVHAVSRTQVSSVDLDMLQAQLLGFGWLQVVKQPSASSSQTWLEVSKLGKKTLALR